MRDIAIGAGPFAHLAHVDAGAHPGEVGLFAVRLLQPQCEQDRGAGRLEDQKAAVAGPVDDAAAHVRRHPGRSGGIGRVALCARYTVSAASTRNANSL